MFEVGSILHGIFHLNNGEQKEKFAIIFDLNEDLCIISTFTTSQPRSGTLNPIHGANPDKQNPESYVFQKDKVIGICPSTNTPFSFGKDTTIVPDYGFTSKSISDFSSKVSNLQKVCQLNKEEIIELFYVLKKCKKIHKWMIPILEEKLFILMSE